MRNSKIEFYSYNRELIIFVKIRKVENIKIF